MQSGRHDLFRLAMAVLCAVPGALVFRVPRAARSDDYRPGTPLTYLFDTGSASLYPLSAQALAAKNGWIRLPEDDLAHRPSGDMVLLNDKLLIVLRAKGPGAEVYSKTAAAMEYRLVLIPLPAAARRLSGWSSVRIRENNPGAVMLEVTFRVARREAQRFGTRGEVGTSSQATLTFRLSAGQRVLEIRPGRPFGGGLSQSPRDGMADRLVVWGKSRYVVVPDFFGDDMVFGTSSFAAGGTAAFDRCRLGLPTENFCLNLLEGGVGGISNLSDQGDAIAMCVWKSSRQEATALLWQHGRQPVIGGCEIQCIRGEPMWVALIEGADIWHRHATAAGKINREKENRQEVSPETVLNWKPPFAARWRADFVWPGGRCVSRNFGDPTRPGCPCRFEADRTLVEFPPVDQTVAPAARTLESILVYPIDRSRATPLRAFCPTDVLRNTLGVGPCQYILQTEGLTTVPPAARTLESSPTPNEVIRWIQKRLEKKKAKPPAEQITEMLGRMTEHVGRVQARIDQYAAMVQDVRTLCKAEGRSSDASRLVRVIGPVLDDMQRTIAVGRGTSDPVQRIAALADQIAALLGKEDAQGDFERLGAQLRSIAAAQDRTLSKCRMMTRWLRQQVKMTAGKAAPGAELAGKIQARAEQMLKNE